jgi:hypothetical protein
MNASTPPRPLPLRSESILWSTRSRGASAALALLMSLSACAENVDFVPIALRYRGPAPGSIPPPTILDGSCYHHSAPLNLVVSTSWGAQGRLEPSGPETYELTFDNVPTGVDHWISFLDIALCPTGRALWVTAGVSVNGVALSRVDEAEGRARLRFRLDRKGKVVP